MTELEDLQAIKAELATTLARLERLIGDMGSAGDETADVASLERTRAIEWVLERHGQPMRPIEIWSELQALGRNDPKMEVQVTTYDLWKRERIEKVSRGLYRALTRT
ncbi:hypothetical protein ABN028_19380 [Actinopolymorpha sp. B17G11]|uniref:hypothetical protein n=1 Tax=Actinopolymorpha sp. B17G11 TaxID=3160861 RepID=UPI0032E38CC9